MSETALKNEVGLSEELIKLLKMDFRKLEGVDAELPDQIIRYIIDGNEGDFPVTLSTATYGGLKHAFPWGTSHGSFLRKYNLIDASPLLRLAKIYDVISKNQSLVAYAHSRSSLSFPFVDLTFFLSILLQAFRNQSKKFSINLLEEVFTLASENKDTLAKLIFFYDLNNKYDTYWFNSEIQTYQGFSEFAERHGEVIREALRLPKAEQRHHALEILNKRNLPVQNFVAEIASLACSSAKSERNEASFLLKKCGDEAIPHLQGVAAKGTPAERVNAVKLLFELQGEKSTDFLTSRLETDKSANVRDAIDDLINQKTVQAEGEDNFNLTVPPLPKISLDAPLSKEFFSKITEAVEKTKKDYLTYYEANKHNKWVDKPQEIDSQKLEKFFDLLQSGTGQECQKFIFLPNQYSHLATQNLLPHFISAEIKPIHRVRLALIQNYNNSDFLWHLNQITAHSQQNPETRFNLRELSVILMRLKISDNQITQNFLYRNQYYNPLSSFLEDDENIWQFLFDKQDDLEQALYANETDKRQNALFYLAKFPQIPPRFRAKLWEFALGKAKAERGLAQKCLETDRRKTEKLLEALKSRSADVRAVAAEWLGNSGSAAAVKSLRDAISAEKSDAAKDQMLRALEKLGASVEEYLNIDRLAEDAKSGLKGDSLSKTVPWLNTNLLPKIKWADTKKEVAPEILQWFIVQTVRQKQIQPSPLLRRYLEKIEKSGREKFGQFVLESWIAADIEPFPADEAEKRANNELASAKTYWQYWQSQGYTEESYFQQQFNHYLKRPKGSAIKEKGILAITAAGGGAGAVPPIERYIKEFHGHRLKHSIALVEVLGELGDLTAVQVLLSIANRFRTKGIQEEAKRQVDLLAERNGWTLDELADRTIPTLGFNDKGELNLSYGSRSFTAKLDKDFNFLLFDESGKKIKSLPAARKEDDAELVKDAKQTFANAKKNLKQILALQKERLYEAMCSQRSWRFADWQAFLNGHPILRRYCQTLVWQTVDEKTSITFRPLDDGTLTDAEDNEAAVDKETPVRLAHHQTVSPEVAESWQSHLSDYEVVPIFPQFGRELPELSEEDKNAVALKDFEGWMIETFKLRGKATSLGFTRGQAEDAGWFYYYKKNFPLLELEAFIEFTGNFLPEENRSAALLALSFARTGKQTSGYLSHNSNLKIKDVPPVVLCEVWNDMKIIANTGTGFDEDWKKKSEY